MSIAEFENRRAWPRWRAMDSTQREQAQARAVEVVADLLEDADRRDFPSHPVVLNGREIDWHITDRAFTMARQAPGEGTVFERWCSLIHRAQAEYDAQVREWERGRAESVLVGEPPRGSARDRDRLGRLEAPVLLVSYKVRAAL